VTQCHGCAIALSAQTATVLQVADSEDRWAAKIVAAIRLSATALDDDELAARVGASQPQTITPICQRLESWASCAVSPARKAGSSTS